MAKPITKINQPVLSEQERETQKLEQVLADVAQHADGIRETAKLLQELHESGMLSAVIALVEAKEKIAQILVGQAIRPNVTKTINNLMGAAGVLGDIEPLMTKKLVSGISKGMNTAQADLATGKKVGLLDLYKTMKDPDVGRAIKFGLGFLKGLGQGLKEEK